MLKLQNQIYEHKLNFSTQPNVVILKQLMKIKKEKENEKKKKIGNNYLKMKLVVKIAL